MQPCRYILISLTRNMSTGYGSKLLLLLLFRLMIYALICHAYAPNPRETVLSLCTKN